MFGCLTRSNACYLEKSANAQAIRDRLVEAGLEGSAGPSESGSESVTPRRVTEVVFHTSLLNFLR